MKEVTFKVYAPNGDLTYQHNDRLYVYERFAEILVYHREYKSNNIKRLARSTDYKNGGHVFTFYMEHGFKYVFDMDI